MVFLTRIWNFHAIEQGEHISESHKTISQVSFGYWKLTEYMDNLSLCHEQQAYVTEAISWNRRGIGMALW